MPRPTILTAAVLARVSTLVNQGLTAAEIAKEMGCTLGTLRVKCSQVGISLRRRPNSLRAKASGPHEIRRSTQGPVRPAQSSRAVRTGRRSAGVQRSVELTLEVPQATLDQLRHWAALRGLSDAALAAELLITIARDSLCDAVLDHG
jgi:hypothetical protein